MSADRGPALEDVDVVEDVVTHFLNETRAQVILASSVGLDSMSSVDFCGDGRMLTDIRAVTRLMKVICCACVIAVTQIGDLDGCNSGWYRTRVIANLLTLSNPQRRYKVLYKNEERGFFTRVPK